MQIEKLQPKHFNFLKAILSKRWNMSPEDLDYFVNRWSAEEGSSICYIGLVDDLPMAYGVFDTAHEVFEDLKPVCTSLWVHPDFRGNGYGYEFTKLRFAHAKKLGYKEIFLDTLSAMDYHLKFGWEIVDKRMWEGMGR